MRSIKRPRRPVHRYRSLLFPGIAVLAVLAFYAAFVPSEKGKAELFEHGGLKIEITNVREVGRDFSNDGPELWEYPVYTVYPGAEAAVLEADMGEDASGASFPRWFFYLEPGDRRLDAADGMEPVELTPEVLGIVDGDGGAWLVRFEIWEEGG